VTIQDISSSLPSGDLMLDLPRGFYVTFASINKYGRATNVDSGVDTDIWDRANATDDDDIWTAPTQARVHNIVSSDANDDGSPAGTGMRTMRVYGLTDWDTREVTEDITLNGTTNVPTANSYVIIHRMHMLTAGASGPNVGIITATAVTDATITAQINAGEGQTQMAVYGVPSTQIAFMTKYYVSAIKTAAALRVALSLLVNPIPDAAPGVFVTKHTIGLDTTGNNYLPHDFKPYYRIDGPAIIKMQANASANDTDVSAGFDVILTNR
jgi:hypothetical protein